MEAKRGKKRALEADGSQDDNGEMAGKEKVMRGGLRGGEEEEMAEGLARAVQGQGQRTVQGQGPSRAALPHQPVKRMGKSRAASTDLFIKTPR